MTSSSELVITGKAIFHLHSCPTRAWLFIHGQLVVPRTNDYIRSGEKLDKQRFSNKRSLDLMPYGKADWVTGAQTDPVIHEGSRAIKHTDPKRAQLRHYLWTAKKLYGIDATGELHLKKGHVERIEPDHEAVESDHERLRQMKGIPMPEPVRISICRGCTNKDWCWE